MLQFPKCLNTTKEIVLRVVSRLNNKSTAKKRCPHVNSDESIVSDDHWVRVNRGSLCFFEPVKRKRDYQRALSALRHKLSRSGKNQNMRGVILPIISLTAVFLVAGSLQISGALHGDSSLDANERGPDSISRSRRNEFLDVPSEQNSSDAQLADEKPTPRANDTARSLRMRQPTARKISNEHSRVELDPFKCTRMSVKQPSVSEPTPKSELQKDLWYVCR